MDNACRQNQPASVVRTLALIASAAGTDGESDCRQGGRLTHDHPHNIAAFSADDLARQSRAFATPRCATTP